MGSFIRMCAVCCMGLLLAHSAGAVEVREENLTRKLDGISIDVKYPVLGLPAVDKDIAVWARQLADNFQSNASTEAEELRKANSDNAEMFRVPAYELSATYTITRASEQVISVSWEVWEYFGGAHGNMDIITMTYDTKTGEELSLYDLFENLDEALNVMSVFSRKVLRENLGTMLSDDMMLPGTAPEADNFLSFALIPDGIEIFFQPYQVAPWAAGRQSVDIPLSELEKAGPRLSLWGRSIKKK